jgi:predicted amidohydrolase YtcJ
MSLLLTGGSVFDGHTYRGAASVLLDGDRVLGVGAASELRERAPGATEVDCAGGLVSPGFVDAHVHVVQGGLERLRCDLSECATAAECLDAIAAYADRVAPGDWLLGGGWSMASFPGGTPTAEAMDRVTGERPAFLPNRDHHGAWVNSAALRAAGITKDTPDPADGRIERDPDGHPTGTLHEGAMALVGDLVSQTTDQELYDGLLAGQRYLHSLGVTGWQDAIIGDYAGMMDPGPSYRRAVENGTLTGDVVGALWWDRNRGLSQLPDLLARREELSSGRFRATSVKIMQDGVAENFTAAMLHPYLDRCGHATDNRGHSFLPAADLREAVQALAGEGFQVHIHAIGDRGVREALDALDGAQPGRHHIAHVQVVHPDDVRRFAELGVAANLQALWACADDQMTELTLPFLGPERAAWQYPFADLHRAGARLVAGSDWPVSSPDPLQAIHVAVNRVAHGDDTPPFLPDQALDLDAAFAAYTSGSAWVNHRDDAGVLSPGAVADVVLLDRDPFAGAPEEIGAARVVRTWLGGEEVS